MKKSLKIYLWLWLVAVVAFGLNVALIRCGVFSPHHRLAQDVTNVEKITGLDLPETNSSHSRDNLERTSSRWDCFMHHTYFKGELSSDCINQLEALCRTDSLHWSKDSSGDCYEYYDGAWDRGGDYCICCRIYDDHAFVEYYVDELECLTTGGIGLIAVFVLVVVLVLWGVSLLIDLLIKKCCRGAKKADDNRDCKTE